jgi:hypothetical protein
MLLLAAVKAATAVPVWTTLAAAAIGAGGAVLAQIVVSLFTNHRENKRLEQERQRYERETDRLKQTTFLDNKRNLFVGTLQLIHERHTALARGAFEHEGPDGPLITEALNSTEAFMMLMTSQRAEFDILAPEIVPAFLEAVNALMDWSLTLESSSANSADSSKRSLAQNELHEKLEALMRTSLGIN